MRAIRIMGCVAAQELNADITLAHTCPALHAPTTSAKAGTYERWYHCHILEHEDNCMMSHFHVDA